MPMRSKLLSRVVRPHSKIPVHPQIKSAIRLLTLIAILAFASLCFAQQPTQASAPETQQAAAASMLTVPAGTKIQMILLRPISTRSAKSGDTVYLQTTFPVMAGDKLLIPAGTFAQGTLANFKRRKDSVDLQLQSAALIFSTGYKVNLPAAPDVAPSQDADIRTKDGHPKAAAGTYAGATGGGTAIGAMAAGTRGAIAGGAIGGPVGFVLAVILINHGRSTEIEAGSPVDITLMNPLLLDERQVAEAARKAGPMLAVNKPKANTAPNLTPRPMGTCFTPETPGTPPTIIPGSAGSAPTVIPGTPAIPGAPYPCPL